MNEHTTDSKGKHRLYLVIARFYVVRKTSGVLRTGVLSVSISMFAISFYLAYLISFIDLKTLSFSDPSWFGSWTGVGRVERITPKT